MGRGTSLPDLAEDIALEARLALAQTEEIKEVDERTTTLGREMIRMIITSAPGIGAVIGAVSLGGLGDAGRFRSLAAVRAVT